MQKLLNLLVCSGLQLCHINDGVATLCAKSASSVRLGLMICLLRVTCSPAMLNVFVSTILRLSLRASAQEKCKRTVRVDTVKFFLFCLFDGNDSILFVKFFIWFAVMIRLCY